MKKKIIALVAITTIAILAVVGIPKLFPSPEKQEGDKTLLIIVLDEGNDKELFREEVRTEATTLGGLLDGAAELKMVAEDSTFGRFITSLCDVEQGDINTGPWWLYESENNEQCQSQGMCPGIDDLIIQDGDEFTFKLTSSY